ncbi:hypothetical protein BV25DRAFT_1889658 [Artomyces pyxidatus]|uniref:Uncharacterized protein n=1 Tax=Artomyces pyxidatus TaxID=48021 RepID=A0ACB8SS28_9AGAM|nr:hypothetical protein BV25DRAFT_1889658 [Artomyces pyxidatus]
MLSQLPLSTRSQITVEVCVDSLQSAANAVNGGADRLEVCGNLGLGGGTTPSMGLVQAIQRKFPETPLMVMVRPRTGDFCYSSSEFDVMLEDVGLFNNIGVAGVVFGVLQSDGKVDIQRTKSLVDLAWPMKVCIHRAFDMTPDAMEAYDAISQISGVTRILTSGQGASAPSSLPILRSLLERAQHSGPSILPGSGISPKTISTVLDALLPMGLTEVHLSGGHWREGEMAHRPIGMGMGVGGDGEWGIWQTEESIVREVRHTVDKAVSR